MPHFMPQQLLVFFFSGFLVLLIMICLVYFENK